jgi:uncharacterized protein YkwD
VPRPARRVAPARLLAVLTVVGLATFAGPLSATAGACVATEAGPGQASSATLEQATVCLLNVERGKRGLGSLRSNSRLGVAADRHARDMVRRSYFSHTSPGGTSFSTRIRKTGYLTSASSWSVGENLAWGSGSYSTPRSTMGQWMKSPGHRANVLRRGYREIGAGLAQGTPRGGSGATFAHEFGRRG